MESANDNEPVWDLGNVFSDDSESEEQTDCIDEEDQALIMMMEVAEEDKELADMMQREEDAHEKDQEELNIIISEKEDEQQFMTIMEAMNSNETNPSSRQFPALREEEIDEIVAMKQSKSTQKSTKYAVTTFKSKIFYYLRFKNYSLFPLTRP